MSAPFNNLGGPRSLEELHRLIESADAEVTGEYDFRLKRIDRGYFVSRQRAEKIAAMAAESDANGIAFDVSLSPTQLNNLADLSKMKVVDRQAIILDIFARRAHTREGKLQVELAQLEYLLPRLRGYGIALSRLGGGIGTRGPGETMLETDRRVMGRRIGNLKAAIEKVRRQRQTQRQNRQRHGIPLIALIGYTNAGKSTLLNTLTDAGAGVADQLFATLDPKSRQLTLPNGSSAVIADTVGFIHNLPTALIAAFRATLEEMQYASLIVHLIDKSSPDIEREFKATQSILDELNLLKHPRLVVYNKIDLVDPHGYSSYQLSLPDYLPSASISARTGQGLKGMLEKIEQMITQSYESITVLIPFERSDLVNQAQEEAFVDEMEHLPEGTRLHLRCTPRLAGQLKRYIVR